MRHFIDAFLEPALWFTAEWSLRWAALLIVVALMLWIFRPRRAAIRQSMLLAALSAGLLVPFAPRWGGGWQRTHQLAKPSISPVQSVTPSFPSSAWERTSGSSASRPTREPAAKQSVAPVRSQAELGNERREDESKQPSEPLGQRRLFVLSLACCWSLTVLCLLIRRLGGWFVLRRLRRESVEATGAAADLFVACRAEMHIYSIARLEMHSSVLSPVLFGFLRPMILVPPDWPQRDIEVQRAGLLHELAHVRRRDHLLTPFLEIVRIAFFFHPLVRWLLARLEYERELLCDEMVVRQGIDPRDYARLLLEFARASRRLAWPAASLPMSRRRTVKGRIHHLLEEDMERWIRPLPMRWTVVLGAGLLTLSLGLASYRVWAEEKDKPKNAPVTKAKTSTAEDIKKRAEQLKRDELRYGGKDFYQWRRELLTELKPAIRADGLTALGTFGVNGYGAEATRAILDMMRGYDPAIENQVGHEDAPVVTAGFRAIEKIRAAAVPTLAAAVKDENRNVRHFAIEALGRLRSDAKAALPALLQASKNDDPKTRAAAIYSVGMIGQGTQEVVAALIEALKDKDDNCRDNAVSSLGMIGQSAKPAIPALLKALKDEEASVRQDAIFALRNIGAGAKAVPAISSLFRDEDGGVRKYAFGYLRALKPEETKEAIPALIAALKEPKNRFYAIDQLERIGPVAREAAPALNELLRSDDSELRNTVVRALKAISPDGKR